MERWIRTVAPGAYLGNIWVELTLVALVYTLLLVLLIRVSRLGPRIQRARRQVVAEAYGLLLYFRSPRTVLRTEARLIGGQLRWLGYWLPALLVGGLLFALLWPALTDRYDYRGAPVGQSIVLRERLTAPEGAALLAAEVHDPAGAVQVTARVRAPVAGTVWSRMTVHRGGLFQLRLGDADLPPVPLNVMAPGRPALPWHYRDGVELHIDYPPRSWWGLPHGWLVYFLSVSTVSAVVLGRRLKVEW
jgi:hypothetical protein